jgi:hypothetical protein
LTLPANSDLLFTGGTGTNDIVLTNGLSDALSITDGSADVVVIDTSTAGNVITLTSALNIGSVAAAGTDTDKFLVLDSSGNVDYRTGTQVLSDIGGSAATGDFSGPGSSTDNAIVRFDATGGKTGQNSGVTIDDSNNITIPGTVTVGSDGSGTDVIFYSATAGDNLTWDASDKVLNITGTNAETALDVLDGDVRIVDKLYFYDVGGEYLSSDGSTLSVTGATTVTGALTVGVDDTGHDVKFFGAAAGAFMLYDQSCNLLDIRGATAAGPGHLKLTTGELTVVACDVLGRIDFQAPLEADCSADARLVGATIAAVAQGTFGNAVNATDLIFYTGHSEAATEKFRFTSQGEIGIAGANYGSDGQVLTSTGGGTAVAWEDVGGGTTINNATADELVTIGATTTELCAEANLLFDGTKLRIGSSASVGSGTQLEIQGTMTAATGHIGQAAILSTDSLAADVGGELVLGGVYTGSSRAGWAGIAGLKENSSCGNYAGYLSFLTRVHGSAASEKVRINSTGAVFVGDTVNGCTTQGVTINQAGADNEILAFKSSDVGHGVTCITETDTYGFIKKGVPCDASLNITGLSESNGGIFLQAISPNDVTAKSAGCGVSRFSIKTSKVSGSGTGTTAPGSDANLVDIRSESNIRFIFDQEGTAHADVGTATYDDYCDIELMRGFLAETVPCYREQFGQDMMYNLCQYEDMKLIGKDSVHWEQRDCGKWQQRAMVNFTGLTMLHHSTIIQMHDNLQTIIQSQEQRISQLENQIALGGK